MLWKRSCVGRLDSKTGSTTLQCGVQVRRVWLSRPAANQTYKYQVFDAGEELAIAGTMTVVVLQELWRCVLRSAASHRRQASSSIPA
jgi:hypothetical protein